MRELASNSKKRVLLVGGVKKPSELKKFLRSVRVPPELLSRLVGTMFGYSNLQVNLPSGVALFAVDLMGEPDLWWEVVPKAALEAGYSIAEVRGEHILLHGAKEHLIAVSECSGVIHNVYQSSSPAAQQGIQADAASPRRLT